jgi:hypothetical protein
MKNVTDFSDCLFGQIFVYFGYIFRDILPLISKIIFNSLSVYLVRKYVKNKQKIRAATPRSKARIENFDRKQTYIALLMSTFSLAEHFLYIVNYALYFVDNFDLSTIVYISASVFIAAKHIFFYFILLILNNLFRNEVKFIFKFY